LEEEAPSPSQVGSEVVTQEMEESEHESEESKEMEMEL
jgi:hypothetical protein